MCVCFCKQERVCVGVQDSVCMHGRVWESVCMCQGGDQVLNKCCFSAETEAAPGCTLYSTG